MSDMIKIGRLVLNLDHVRQIFEDEANPGTWNVFIEMSSTGLVQGLSFSGEEGQTVKFFVDNYVRDMDAMRKLVEEASLSPMPLRRGGKWDDGGGSALTSGE